MLFKLNLISYFGQFFCVHNLPGKMQSFKEIKWVGVLSRVKPVEFGDGVAWADLEMRHGGVDLGIHFSW